MLIIQFSSCDLTKPGGYRKWGRFNTNPNAEPTDWSVLTINEGLVERDLWTFLNAFTAYEPAL